MHALDKKNYFRQFQAPIIKKNYMYIQLMQV